MGDIKARGIFFIALLVFLSSGCLYVEDGKVTFDLNQFIKEDDSGTATEGEDSQEQFKRLKEEYERTGEVPEELLGSGQQETKPSTTTSPPTTTRGPIIKLPTIDPVLRRAEPYLEPIETENIDFRKKAASIVSSCPYADKNCQVNGIYRYVVENFKYYSDPRRDEFVQTPDETQNVGGGDCEDLTILLNTYLENLGIETYVVLTDAHAYSLACGVETDKLFEYVYDSLTDQLVKEYGKSGTTEIVKKDGDVCLVERKTQKFSLEAAQTYYYGGDGSYFQSPYKYLDIEYSVSSSRPLGIYFVPTRNDFQLLSNLQAYTHYPSCQRSNIYSITDSCDGLSQYGGIALQNPDWDNDATVSLDLNFYIAMSVNDVLYELLEEGGVSAYTIGGETCIVLDATAGEWGYPGYDGNLLGDKVAINTVTKKYYNLI